MKIACIGGGPASLYFAILLKKARPDVAIDVFEQNRAVQKAKVRASESRKEGYNFCGLQTYIISEIDSGSDNKGKAAG